MKQKVIYNLSIWDVLRTTTVPATMPIDNHYFHVELSSAEKGGTEIEVTTVLYSNGWNARCVSEDHITLRRPRPIAVIVDPNPTMSVRAEIITLPTKLRDRLRWATEIPKRNVIEDPVLFDRIAHTSIVEKYGPNPDPDTLRSNRNIPMRTKVSDTGWAMIIEELNTREHTCNRYIMFTGYPTRQQALEYLDGLKKSDRISIVRESLIDQ